MRYINKTLLNNEKIVYATHPHWIVFVPGSFILLISIILYGFGPTVSYLNWSIASYTLYEIFAIICAAVGLISLGKHYIIYKTSDYGITDKRILMKTGWIQRNSLELFLDKIEAVHVDQTIMGRIIGYGTVIIIGTGGSRDPFINVPKPLYFRKMVQQEIDNEEERHRR